MEIIHISAECYPVAKAGGLGDVVGALPKYQCKAGHDAKVVMPLYKTKFLTTAEWDVDYKADAYLGNQYFAYTVLKEKNNALGFPLYLIEIPGLTDREKIYGYADDTERFLAFQIALLDWISQWQHVPDIIHCHDHHTGMVPFMMQFCYRYAKLSKIRSIFTIHNAQYQGWMDWSKLHYLPHFDNWKTGLLEWKQTINPLACAIKCAWKVTTVSNTYMGELRYSSNGLENLFEYEKGKCIGILNGIDNEVWNPKTDTYLENHYEVKSVEKGKKKNKELICDQFNLDKTKPLFVFIGRLVGEKAADVLPDAIKTALYYMPNQANYLILGTGEAHVEWQFEEMIANYQGQYNAVIGYKEALSHLLYAGADYLLMPSRVEPCGLNQMYAMRYGTVPMVRNTGGLADTVVDFGDSNGFGIKFNHASINDITYSIGRAIEVYQNTSQLNNMRKIMMQIDHSWEQTVNDYTKVYTAF